MEKRYIKPTTKSPEIKFYPSEGIIELKGRSIPENAKKIYEPLVENWMGEYVLNPAKITIVNIHLEYYNTSTSMWLLRLFDKLENITNTEINWFFADEDMEEAGEDYKALIQIPFNLIEE